MIVPVTVTEITTGGEASHRSKIRSDTRGKIFLLEKVDTRNQHNFRFINMKVANFPCKTDEAYWLRRIQIEHHSLIRRVLIEKLPKSHLSSRGRIEKAYDYTQNPVLISG